MTPSRSRNTAGFLPVNMAGLVSAHCLGGGLAGTIPEVDRADPSGLQVPGEIIDVLGDTQNFAAVGNARRDAQVRCCQGSRPRGGHKRLPLAVPNIRGLFKAFRYDFRGASPGIAASVHQRLRAIAASQSMNGE